MRGWSAAGNPISQNGPTAGRPDRERVDKERARGDNGIGTFMGGFGNRPARRSGPTKDADTSFLNSL